MGNPRLNGGDGLIANYYQNDQILFDEHENFEYNIADVNLNAGGVNVFKGETTDGKILVIILGTGKFAYTAKIHPQSAKVNTGVKWEDILFQLFLAQFSLRSLLQDISLLIFSKKDMKKMMIMNKQLHQ